MGPKKRANESTDASRPVRRRKSTYSRAELTDATDNSNLSANAINQESTNALQQNDLSTSANIPMDQTANVQPTITIDYAKLAREIIVQQNLLINNASQQPEGNNIPNATSTQRLQSVTPQDQSINTQHHANTNLLQSSLMSHQPSTATSTCTVGGTCSQVNSNDQPLNNQISSLVNNILGMEPPATGINTFPTGQRPTDLSAGIPLGAHISQKIREKIWADEFIELRSLLPKNVDNDAWSVTLAPSQ